MRPENMSCQTTYECVREILGGSAPDKDKKKALDAYHDYELAEALIRLDPVSRETFIKIYPPAALVDVFASMEPDDVASILPDINITLTSEILNLMQTDDLIDVLGAFGERDTQIRFLSMVHQQKRNEIKQIIAFGDNRVGSIMNDDFITVCPEDTVKEAIRHVVDAAPDHEFIDTVYVARDRVLIGVLSLSELITAGHEPKQTIDEIMIDNVISLRPTDRIEEAIEHMRKYDFMLMPVIDEGQHIIGIVSYDDVLDAINSESDIDYSLFAGLTDVQEPIDRETVRSNLRKRIPWLSVLLFVNLFTGSIIAGFESTLRVIPVLAVFMPLVLGMAGNSGTQSLGTIIKLFALNRFKSKKDKWRHLFREIIIGLLNGMVIGMVMAMIVILFQIIDGKTMIDAWPLALTVSSSITLALTISTFAGTLIPLAIDSIHIDPAVASGPFMTTVIDIFSLLVYFGFAVLFMQQLM